MLAGTSTTEPFTASVPLLIAAGAVGLAWLGLLGALAAARHAPRVRAAGGGMDVPPESPAVAGMLANDFVLPAETAPAILLDLAARGVVDLEEIRPGQTICRVRHGGGDASLSTAERGVLDAVQAKAIDGIVPTDALSTGTNDQSKRWHRELRRAVVAESQAAGLTTDRWVRSRTVPLLLGAFVIGLLLWISIESGDEVTGGRAVTAGIAGVIAIGSLGAGALVVSRWLTSLAQLPTEAGMRAAERAVGLEEYLRSTAGLDELPPAAVKLRGRHLAYAATFGLAPLAVALLPMGEEDDRRAWSRFGGRWRRVRVRYPLLVPPAWGRHPALSILLAVLWLTLGVLAFLGSDALRDSLGDSGLTAEQHDILEISTIVWMAPFAVGGAWALWVLIRAVPDLFQHRSVVGEAVRVRRRTSSSSRSGQTYRYYVALDDGSDNTVRAYRVRAAIWGSVRQGDTYTAEVTPRVGYVRSINRS